MTERLASKTIWFDWLRDRAYDTVFHAGDTTQQFLWDAVYGPENTRQNSYTSRQICRQVRKGEVPFTRLEQSTFQKILKRHENEKLLDFWRHRSALLKHPNKKELVASYIKLEKQQRQKAKSQSHAEQREAKQQLEKQFREISSLKSAQASTSRHRKKQR